MHKILPNLLAILAAMVLIFIAYAADKHEIILPTFGALMTGAWLVPNNLWHYHKFNLIVCLTLSSCVGLIISILISGLDYIAVYPCLYLGFLIAACILIFGRNQIYPCFGAMTLPILFRTTSWFYPLSVFCIALTLIGVQKLLECTGARQPMDNGEFPEHHQHRRERIIYYLQTSLGLVPALILVALSGNHWFFLPPLFVTNATFCNKHSTFTHYPIQTWAQLVIASVTGNLAFYIAVKIYTIYDMLQPMHYNLIVSLMVGVAVCMTMIVGKLFHRLFPPAMSLAITPFLVQFNLYMPACVAVTSAYLIFIAWSMRTHPAYKGRDLSYL